MNTKFISTVLLTLLLSACAKHADLPAPNTPSPTIIIPDQWQAAPVSSESSASDSRDLLTLFDESTLARLVDKALLNNFDLMVSFHESHRDELRARVDSLGLLPDLSIQSTFSDQKESVESARFNLSLDVSWELDIWGKLRDRRRASRNDVKSLHALKEGLRSSIVAQTMQAWFALIETQKTLDITQSQVDNLRQRLGNLEKRYRFGLDDARDYIAVRRDLGNILAELQSQIDNRNSARRSLELLIGEYPEAQIVANANFPIMPQSVKAGTPAGVILNRYDLRAAWFDVMAADARALASHKDRFPSLTLTGSFGKTSNELRDLIDGASITSLASSLFVPLFDSRRLKKLAKAERSNADAVWASFLQKCLIAFREVEESLDKNQLLSMRTQELNSAEIAAKHTLSIAESRYQNGLISILDLLDAEQVYFETKLQQVAAKSAYYQNRVNVHLALGAGV